MYQKDHAPFWQPVCHNDTWKPIFYLTKFLGYAPISRDTNGFYTSNTDVTFSIAALAIYATMFAMNFISHASNFYKPIDDSSLLDIGLNVSVLICNFTALVVVVSNYINRHQICGVSHAIQAIDDELIKLGCELNYRRTLIVHVIHIGVALVGQLALYCACFYLRQRYEIFNLPDQTFVFYFGVTITYSIYMSNFIFIMVNIEKRYKAINQTLKRYFVKKPLALTPGLGHVCTKLAKLHDYLGDNVDVVNSAFAIQVVVTRISKVLVFNF